MSTVAILGALDTKGKEYLYLKRRIESMGVSTVVVDVSAFGEPAFAADYPAEFVAAAANEDINALRASNDRAYITSIMSEGAGNIICRLIAERAIQGLIAMGGAQGSSVAAAVMRRAPFGFPKMLISTVVGVEKRQVFFEGVKDMFGVNPTTDVAGLNSIMCTVMDNAAAAIVGMAQHFIFDRHKSDKKRVAFSMLGVTTPCVSRIATALEDRGCEAFVFHATGYGGQNLEQMVRDGEIDLVIDITPTELGHQCFGHDSAAMGGRPRMTAAGEMEIPQIVAPGALDLINYTYMVPEEFSDRRTIANNKNAFAIRTSREENILFARTMAERLNASKARVIVLIPLMGFSKFDSEGNKFFDPEIDRAFIDTLIAELDKHVEVIELDCSINDPAFSDVAIQKAFECLM